MSVIRRIEAEARDARSAERRGRGSRTTEAVREPRAG
jgi:hypothetical protein